MSSREVSEDPVATSRSKVLAALNSRYTCIHEPLPPTAASPHPYLTSLSVFANREVDEPQSPLSTSSSKPTVDQNIIDSQIIKEKVTAALKVLSFREPRVLVQFWSPVALRKRCLLTTLDQPFGLGVVDEGLYSYRLESEQRVFVVDGEFREDLGPPGRVYRQKLPEWSLDAHGLSNRRSVQDWAASHNIRGYINLPVFEPASGCCVGVLELITSSNYVDYAFEVRQVSRALKEESLRSPNALEDTCFYTRVGDEKTQLELDEIFCALKMVCDSQNLPLAQTWGPCGYSSVVANSGKLERSCSSFSRNCIGKVCMSTAALPFYVRDLSMWGFHEACTARHLDKSQGVVGRSLSSSGLCYCGDVSKLGEDKYPLVPYARMHGVTSCLAIYLKSPEVDCEYVVELFLPTQNENEAGIESLVKTVKEQIKNASRIQLGNMSSPQVIGGIPLNWNLESPTSTDKLEVPPELENLHSLEENGKNDTGVDAAFLKEFAAGTNQNAVVPYTDGDINTGKRIKEPIRKKKRADGSISLEEDKPLNPDAAGTNQNVVVSYLEVGVEDVDTKPIRKRKRIDRSISLEEISKHYGKTMEEAADSLRVSRSTLKRICRGHGIPRWPYIRTPNESDPLLKPGQTDVAIHASDSALTTLVLGSTNATEHSKHTSTLVVHPKAQENLPT